MRWVGKEFRGLMMSLTFESGEAGEMGSLVEVNSGLGGQIIFLSKMACK